MWATLYLDIVFEKYLGITKYSTTKLVEKEQQLHKINFVLEKEVNQAILL